MLADDTNTRWGKLRVSKRLRNQHRRARRINEISSSLKQWAREQAGLLTPAQRDAWTKHIAVELDKRRALTTPLLAHHWLTIRDR